MDSQFGITELLCRVVMWKHLLARCDSLLNVPIFDVRWANAGGPSSGHGFPEIDWLATSKRSIAS